jgi:AcrR family transcriptional regulator
LTETRTAPTSDRRVQRSRTALRDAFHRLILERGYDAISVFDVTELANVGRSTFYEHYTGLDDLLAQSLDGAFALLGRASLNAEHDPAMTGVLQHFWDNRKVGSALLSGSAVRVLQPLLTGHFETALSAQWPDRSREGAFRRKVLALQLAGGNLIVIREWVSGRLPGTAQDIAEQLRRSCRASGMASSSDLAG